MADDLLPRLLAGAGGGFVAETLTLPTDVIKVRLQVQNNVAVNRVVSGALHGATATATAAATPQYAGMIDCGVKIFQQEGLGSLWKGYTPAILRQVSYSSLMMVLYEPVRNGISTISGGAPSFSSSSSSSGKKCSSVSPGSTDAKPSFTQRLLAGGIAGGTAIAVFNPFEVAKTQIQSDVSGGKTVMSVFRNVQRTDGSPGFWAGVKPNVMRTFLVNAAELGTYDQAKNELFIPRFGDGLISHVGSSGIAGFCSACISTPCDVVKTRLMNIAGAETKPYNGIVDAFIKIPREEGIGALYKGFLPICVRKLIWCAAFFCSYEQIRNVVNKV